MCHTPHPYRASDETAAVWAYRVSLRSSRKERVKQRLFAPTPPLVLRGVCQNLRDERDRRRALHSARIAVSHSIAPGSARPSYGYKHTDAREQRQCDAAAQRCATMPRIATIVVLMRFAPRCMASQSAHLPSGSVSDWISRWSSTAESPPVGYAAFCRGEAACIARACALSSSRTSLGSGEGAH